MKLIHPVLFVLLLGVGALAGCYSQSGTVSHEPVSYLAVSPVKTEMTAVIDGASPIVLKSQKKAVRLQVSPGKHRIQIFDRGNLRVDREIYVSDQQTLEITIP